MRILSLFLILLCSLFSAESAFSETFQADGVPWSGYWWPKSLGGLVTGMDYKGHPSPVEKYDLAVVGKENGPAAQYGLQHYYDPQARDWEGYCFNWAAAAILEKEPLHNGIYGNTPFFVGDKKALLTAAYIGALYNSYPINSPADFHGILEEFISRQRMPIIMDLGTDGEVWFYPVFKYETYYTQVEDTRHFTTTIYYASDAVAPDYTGTYISSSTYHYYFTIDAQGNIAGMGWEGDSIGKAPVRACEPFGTAPQNPGISYDVVKQIASTDDDPYEDNDDLATGAPLLTGTYNLILLDEDYFRVFMKKGDRLKVGLGTDIADVVVKIYGPAGNLLSRNAGEGVQNIDAQEEGEYGLGVVAGDPTNEYLYTLYLEHRLPFEAVFPFHPAGSWTTGVSLFDGYGNIADRKILSLFDANGQPLKSHAFLPGDSLLGVVEGDLGLTNDQSGYIKIQSDSPLLGLQASMALDSLLLGANLIPLAESSQRIFYPYFYNAYGWKTVFGILNAGDFAETVFRKSYGEGGEILGTQSVTLGPGERLEEETAYLPILIGGAKSMSAETVSGRASLLGYVEFLNPSFGAKGRALIPVSGTGDSNLIVPHVALNDAWWTGIVVMNTGSLASTASLSAYDENGNLLAAEDLPLGPEENLVRSPEDLFPAVPSRAIASMLISSENGQSLFGLILYGTNDGNCLAGMPMPKPKEWPLYLPHIATTDGWWTGIGLVNASSATASVSFSLLDKDHRIMAETYRTLNANARATVVVRDLFAGFDLTGARFLKIDSMDKGLAGGIYLIGAEDGSRVMGDILK